MGGFQAVDAAVGAGDADAAATVAAESQGEEVGGYGRGRGGGGSAGIVVIGGVGIYWRAGWVGVVAACI